jgi:hypothetical protein
MPVHTIVLNRVRPYSMINLRQISEVVNAGK